jgi:hypothetical protein
MNIFPFYCSLLIAIDLHKVKIYYTLSFGYIRIFYITTLFFPHYCHTSVLFYVVSFKFLLFYIFSFKFVRMAMALLSILVFALSTKENYGNP